MSKSVDDLSVLVVQTVFVTVEVMAPDPLLIIV